jgi:hypothetical protein
MFLVPLLTRGSYIFLSSPGALDIVCDLLCEHIYRKKMVFSAVQKEWNDKRVDSLTDD